MYSSSDSYSRITWVLLSFFRHESLVLCWLGPFGRQEAAKFRMLGFSRCFCCKLWHLSFSGLWGRWFFGVFVGKPNCWSILPISRWFKVISAIQKVTYWKLKISKHLTSPKLKFGGEWHSSPPKFRQRCALKTFSEIQVIEEAASPPNKVARP